MSEKYDPLDPKTKKPKNDYEFLKSFIWSTIAILPSILIGNFLRDHQVPVQYSYFVGVTVLMLAAFDFATVVFIEQYKSKMGKLTIPALVGANAIIFMFIIAESFNRFLTHVGYAYITPFLLISVILIYIAIFREKMLVMKLYLSLNSMALLLLWTMGLADKIVMPF